MAWNTVLPETNSTEVDGSVNSNRGLSRRRFLQVLGSASAVGVTGCADSRTQNLFPNLKGDPEQVPGVAQWYNSTCTECSAGCGIQVRVREGRAVKVEGNPNNPINRGGLCALGQASLQALYDPDRIREPLKFDPATKTFKAVSWDEGYGLVVEALKDTKLKKAFITGELSGSSEELVNNFCKAFNAQHVTYDLLQPTALARASELVYGEYGIPEYSFAKAEVVLNFGADFLETWISPCGFARDWATARRGEKPIRVVHVEPRLSLTGANADMWLKAAPGTEVEIALAVLKLLLNKGRGGNLSDEVISGIKGLVREIDPAAVCERSGVPYEKLVLTAQYLQDAKASLVVAGGAAAATNDGLPLQVATALLNLTLGNVGTTVSISSLRKPKTSVAKIQSVIEQLNKEQPEVDVVFVYGANPSFSLPSSYGFGYALKRAKLVVSFGSSLDETAAGAHVILPAHHSLESWGEQRPAPGVYNLIQPTMQPVFNTRGFEDSLITIANKLDKKEAVGGVENFQAYLKANWKNVHSAAGAGGDFEMFWLKSLESGGYFAPRTAEGGQRVSVNPSAFKLKFNQASFDKKEVRVDDLIVYPYPSVRSFDGRAANRPWLQELPDPITKIVWDSWAEINPETAKKLNISQGDTVNIRNFYGEVNLPAYVTDFVHPGMVAVPLGQGHARYGRYAESVLGGSILELLPASGGDDVALLATRAKVSLGRGRPELAILQGHDSQEGRGLAQSMKIGAGGLGAVSLHAPGAHAEAAHEEEPHGGEERHAIKQMYAQREHPLYRWGMVVDLAACTGCSACVVACYAENNIPVAGKSGVLRNRQMSWLRLERFYDGSSDELEVSFLPMMCQQCTSAPCEPVCPVFATYHNEEGLNAMVYNRCVGTRYCSNNCPYKVRRFNWFEFDIPEPLTWQLNPDVTKRSVGVMEKCTFCVQRITEAKDKAKDHGQMVADGEVRPACVQSCPTQALTFGNLNDPKSKVSRLAKNPRGYKVLDHHLNTQPAITYLKDIRYKA